MIKFINYIIFHLYKFQFKQDKGDEINSVYGVAVTISIFMFFTIANIFSLLKIYSRIELDKFDNSNNLGIYALISSIIFYFILRSKKFLEYGFIESKTTYIYIIIFVIIFIIISVIIVNKERDYNLKLKEKQKIEKL